MLLLAAVAVLIRATTTTTSQRVISEMLRVTQASNAIYT